MAISLTWLNIMSVAARLSTVRKQKGLTQQALADAVGIHVVIYLAPNELINPSVLI